MKYNIGDRVIVPHKPINYSADPGWVYDMDKIIGLIGKITGIERVCGVMVYEVNYEEITHRDLDFWYFREEWLQPVNEVSSYSVCSDGVKIVTITDNKTGITGAARCHPDDEFDLAIGIQIATIRMEEALGELYYTGPVVCVHSERSCFSEGYVYHFYKGEVVDNEYDTWGPIKELDEMCMSGIEFIPYYGIAN